MRHTHPAVLLTTVALLAGCAAPVEVANPQGVPASPVPLPSGIVIANGHGWTAAGLDGPMPAAGSCHPRAAADGQPLPDPHCTPGAVDTAVTDTNTATTVCRRGGYTSSVRPPESLTEPAKRKLLAAYGIPAGDIGKYELDHLVDLAAGGASDVRNLWPENDHDLGQYPRGTYVHNDKDAVESYTYHAICAGKVGVSAVQAAVVADWTTAVVKLGLPPIPANYQG